MLGISMMGAVEPAQHLPHTFGNGTTNNVNYNVRLIARSSFGCIDTNYQNVIVHPNPIADFTLSDSVGLPTIAHFHYETIPLGRSIISGILEMAILR